MRSISTCVRMRVLSRRARRANSTSALSLLLVLPIGACLHAPPAEGRAEAGLDSTAPTAASPIERDRAAPRDPTAPIQTDSTLYTLRPPRTPTGEEARHRELGIVATYTNRTGRAVFPEYCTNSPPNYYLEKKIKGEWVRAYHPVCWLVGHDEPPFAIEPGESYTATIVLLEAYRLRGSPRFEVDTIPGVYRLVYRLYETWGHHGGGELIPEEARISNEFRIEEQHSRPPALPFGSPVPNPSAETGSGGPPKPQRPTSGPEQFPSNPDDSRRIGTLQPNGLR